jgi:hypothetical protein
MPFPRVSHPNKFLAATLETILILAVIHIVLLIIHVLFSGEWEYLNLADILDADLFMNNVTYGAATWVGGAAIIAALWAVLYGSRKR